MKKIWLTIAGSLLFAFTAVHAQQTQEDQSTEYRRTTDTDQYSWSDEDKEAVTADELPSGLVETLKSDEYKGWENATIYRNKNSDAYMLVMQEDGDIKTLYFDGEGSETSTGTTSSQENETSGPMGTPAPESTHEYSSSDSISSPKTSTEIESSTGSETSESEDGVSEPNQPTSASPSYPMGTGSDRAQGEPGTGTQGNSGMTGQDTELQTQNEASTSWAEEDRVIVVTDEVPASLRVTLEDDKYEGWENSTLYRNRKTDEFMIEIRDGSSSRVYYFDKDGNEIEVKD